MSANDLSLVPLFAGLPREVLDQLERRATRQEFAAYAAICREGEPGSSLFVLLSGLAHVVVGEGEARQVVARLRRGDVLGEMSLISGEPRSATAVAAVPTEALQIDRAAFAEALAAYPQLLDNLARILRERLVAANRRAVRPTRQASALVVGPGFDAAADQVVAEALSARPGPMTLGDRRKGASIARMLDAAEHADVLAVLRADDPALAGVLDYVDRAVLLGTEADRAALQARLPERAGRLSPPGELGWTGRFLARGRLGLALGAGGARGYAHAGVLRALQEAGYRPDAVAGSSIGGVVGALVALDPDAGRLEATLRRVFTPDTVAALFKLSLGPASPALSLWTRLLREMTEDRSFADLPIPLVVMTVDLESGQPAPLREGPLWEALLATTALPGMAPPIVRGGQRLVDGLALVPVPTVAVEPLADVTVAVNLMSRERLPAWPGDPGPPPPKGSGALDVLLEAMELTHTEVSTRHAARADLPITPRFGPSTWKDFFRADAFIAAGAEATGAALPALRSLLHPRRERT